MSISREMCICTTNCSSVIKKKAGDSVFVTYLIKSKTPLIIQRVLILVVKMPVCGGGESTFRIDEICEFST